MADAKLMAARVGLIVGGIGLWYLTQSLLAKRTLPAQGEDGSLRDGVHDLTSSLNRRLFESPKSANALLLWSTLVIDLLGLYVLGSAVFGPSTQPFIGLLIVFALRQICQAFCPLPAPPGMIWRDPGMPTLFVTYKTANDFFFSGHTSMAVFGVACLVDQFGAVGLIIGVLVAAFEIGTVLVLRAHYTMDVFTGAIAALYAYHLAWVIAPHVDRWLAAVLTAAPLP